MAAAARNGYNSDRGVRGTGGSASQRLRAAWELGDQVQPETGLAAWQIR